MNILISLCSPIQSKIDKYAIPLFYENIINEFSSLGHNIHVYVTKEWNKDYINCFPEKIYSFINEISPDLCILFNNTFYDISDYISCPIIIYDVDTPSFFCNKEVLKSNVGRYLFIESQTSSVEFLQYEYNCPKNNILKVPFFTGIKARKREIESNLCFIGSRFVPVNSQLIINKLVKNNEFRTYRGEFLNYLNDVIKNPLKSHRERINDLGYKNIKFFTSIDDTEILACMSDYNRRETLSCVADLGLSIYGSTAWIDDYYNEPYLLMSYRNKTVYSLKHNEDIYNSSKIGININHLQAIEGFSWRVCDILASNACLVTEYRPTIEQYFPNVGILTFTSPFEARQQCLKLLANENLRQDIIEKSHEIIEKKFRFNNFLEKFENFLGISFSNHQQKAGCISYYLDSDFQDDTVQDQLDQISNILKSLQTKINILTPTNTNSSIPNSVLPILNIVSDWKKETLSKIELLHDIQNSEEYKVGNIINLGLDIRYKNVKFQNLYPKKLGFCWSCGTLVKVDFDLSSSYTKNKNLYFEFSAIPFRKQSINLYVNTTLLLRCEFSESFTKKIKIPKKLLNNYQLQISFFLPNASSPKSLGLSEDERILGLAFRYILLSY